MIVTKRISPPYLQFFICDSTLPENPVQGVEKIEIISNGKSLSVPCAYWEEAETELIVGSPEEVEGPQAPQFDTVIPTPSRSIIFHDALLAELLDYPTQTAETRIRIWTDGSILPERVVVAVG